MCTVILVSHEFIGHYIELQAQSLSLQTLVDFLHQSTASGAFWLHPSVVWLTLTTFQHSSHSLLSQHLGFLGTFTFVPLTPCVMDKDDLPHPQLQGPEGRASRSQCIPANSSLVQVWGHVSLVFLFCFVLTALVSLHCLLGLLLVAVRGGYCLVVVCGFLILQWLLLCTGHTAVVHRLSCAMACGNLPGPGIKLLSQIAGRFYPLDHRKFWRQQKKEVC